MGKGARRQKVILAAMVVALVAVVGSLAGPAWVWLTTKRVSLTDLPGFSLQRWLERDRLPHRVPADFVSWNEQFVRGFFTVKRWQPSPIYHGTCRVWFVNTGYLFLEAEYEDGVCLRRTRYLPDGRVASQSLNHSKTPLTEEARDSPPWWWGVRDQTSPSDPQWIAEHGK